MSKRPQSPEVEMSSEDIAAMFEYQGFNAKAFLSHLESIEQDQRKFKTDMRILTTFIAVRGTKIQKSTLKMKSDGISLINSLRMKYGITDAKPTDPTDVTLARISACFADKISRTYQRGIGRVVGKIPRNMPVALCHPSAGSLIPHSYVETFKTWTKWRKSFSLTINGGKARKEDAAFDKIVHDSNMFSEEQRVKFMEEMGVTEEIEEESDYEENEP